MMLINLPLSTAHSSAIVATKAVEYGLRLVRYSMRYSMRDTVWIAEVHGGTPKAQRGIMALAEYFQTHIYAVDAARPEGTPSYHPRDARRDWIMQRFTGDTQ